ncbi:MAG: dephospho-CoA kinase [Saprospiraceae bacterium]
MTDPTSKSSCLRIGITGGMGSGKTTVCRIFESLGIPVYDADQRAKWLIQNDADLHRGIESIFGKEAYLSDGAYNRPWVAKLAFAQPEKLSALNALIHPAVEMDSRDWHEQQAAAGFPYTLREAALMIESGNHRWLDVLIVVTAPEWLRVERVKQRDGLSQAQIQARLANQLPEAEKIRLADYLIANDGERLLVPQVLAIHQQIIARRNEFENIS